MSNIYNFSPGPSKIPFEVINKAQESVKKFKKTGNSILEISHRSKEFQEILDEINENFEKLISLPKNFKVLLLQGGATFQNALIPFNVDPLKSIGCLVTGSWGYQTSQDYFKSFKNIKVLDIRDKEIQKYIGKENTDFSELDYLHITSNETIEGVQIRNFNNLKHDNLIIDMSSDFCSYKYSFNNLSYVYAGAQKNMGIPGVTICLVNNNFLEQDLVNPSYLDLKKLTNANSIMNTPPTFSIYIVKLITDWMIQMGGIEYFESKSKKQSAYLYNFLDHQSSLIKTNFKGEFRSRSNVVFSFLEDTHNKNFISDAKSIGIIGINGHRSVGGIRVSLYNSIDEQTFLYFMDFFEKFIDSNNL